VRRKYILAGVAVTLLLAAGIGWYVMSPWWTVRAMVEAAKAGNADALSAKIDYPALKKDLKADLSTRLNEEAARDKSPAAQMGLAIARSMMDGVIDAFVSPGGIKAAFVMMDEDAPPPKAAPGAKQPGKPRIERMGLNRFRLEREGTAGSGFVFERRGLGWKLTGVDLPSTQPGPPPAQRP
jgi:hypothetical protein